LCPITGFAIWRRLPDEWIAVGKEGVSEAARRIADDIVLAEFPHMERLASPESFFEGCNRACGG
jgi:hypothetical protein